MNVSGQDERLIGFASVTNTIVCLRGELFIRTCKANLQESVFPTK